MDSKIIDTLFPKFLEIAKTFNVPSDLISKIEEAVKSPSISSTMSDGEEAEEAEDTEEECGKCPKCGAEMKPTASVSVAVVKKNPLKDLMDKARM